MTGQYQFESILLVDDDEISNVISSVILKEAKVASDIHMVYNGKQALEFLTKFCLKDEKKNSCPALVFLDLNMPVMDGFEFLEEYLRHENLKQLDLRIVLLTSSAYSKDRERAAKYPIAGFITKPLTKEKLEATFGLQFG